ncbi:site-specific integrase [Pseudomonas gregormendelii]|uniref:Site-specific integrase n=1 Tax=Pseudomonas gregormendelii TaxID=1628277 RepID=A0ABS3AL72_9PSED|nr:site-specific integrase [Pseudomonas gregormendelii]
MAKFASPVRQAAAVVKRLQGRDGVLKSVGTVRNYQAALSRVAEWMRVERLPVGLQSLTSQQAHHYLEMRSQSVGQSALNLERQAIQAMFQHLTHQMAVGHALPVVKSELDQALKSRAYTREQVELVTLAQMQRNSLATEIAFAAGLRAHELLTLRRAHERIADPRPARTEKFQGRAGLHYTVQGKGGLIRQVTIPLVLAERLESLRLDMPRRVTDRGIYYQQYYDLAGGHRWSASYSAASTRVLGWSAGAHGLRHSYAQQRMTELQLLGLERVVALETVSQELGHFRPEITEVYLR